jgi:hypothetical protein
VLAGPARYQVAEADRRIRAWLAGDAIAARVETVYEALVAPRLSLAPAAR